MAILPPSAAQDVVSSASQIWSGSAVTVLPWLVLGALQQISQHGCIETRPLRLARYRSR